MSPAPQPSPSVFAPGHSSHGRPPPGAGRKSIWKWIEELLSGNTWANTLFVSAIAIGFFHGWMKLHYRHPLITFAFDIPLSLSLIIAIFSVRRGDSIFPPGPISTGLKFLLGTCALYGILPFGVPPLVSLAAFRGWSFIPLIFLLGYHLTRSARQIEIFVHALLALGAVTALYGMRQSPDEIQRMMQQDAYLSYRLQGSFYGSTSGAGFRAFSTFVSSGAFGGVMAFCGLFALSRAAAHNAKRPERLVMSALFVLFTYGVVLSGSRSALVMVLFSVLAVAWFRRTLAPALATSTILFLALAAAAYFKGGAFDRFRSLLEVSTVWSRFLIVINPSIDYLVEHPLGGGLGRSGHGIPQLLMRLIGQFEWMPVDGDLGRLVVDMGVIGLAVFAGMLLATARQAYRMSEALRDTPLGQIALPAAAWFIISAITVPIGSPFLGIPVGALTWFFVGALQKLHEEHRATGGLGASVATLNSDPSALLFERQDKRLTFGKSHRTPSKPPASPSHAALPNPTPTPSAPAPQKRFLFKKHSTPHSPTWSTPPPQSNEGRSRRPRL